VIALFSRLFNMGLPKSFTTQSIRFIIVGGATACIDFFVLVFLVERIRINYLHAAAIGFIVGSTLNYIFSIIWVFYRGRYTNSIIEYGVFFLLTCLGLALNQLLMYTGVQYGHIQYTFVKAITLIIVTVFNFTTKKFIVFKQ
jgi:putative flippase GtrA